MLVYFNNDAIQVGGKVNFKGVQYNPGSFANGCFTARYKGMHLVYIFAQTSGEYNEAVRVEKNGVDYASANGEITFSLELKKDDKLCVYNFYEQNLHGPYRGMRYWFGVNFIRST